MSIRSQHDSSPSPSHLSLIQPIDFAWRSCSQKGATAPNSFQKPRPIVEPTGGGDPATPCEQSETMLHLPWWLKVLQSIQYVLIYVLWMNALVHYVPFIQTKNTQENVGRVSGARGHEVNTFRTDLCLQLDFTTNFIQGLYLQETDNKAAPF